MVWVDGAPAAASSCAIMSSSSTSSTSSAVASGALAPRVVTVSFDGAHRSGELPSSQHYQQQQVGSREPPPPPGRSGGWRTAMHQRVVPLVKGAQHHGLFLCARTHRAGHGVLPSLKGLKGGSAAAVQRALSAALVLAACWWSVAGLYATFHRMEAGVRLDKPAPLMMHPDAAADGAAALQRAMQHVQQQEGRLPLQDGTSSTAGTAFDTWQLPSGVVVQQGGGGGVQQGPSTLVLYAFADASDPAVSVNLMHFVGAGMGSAPPGAGSIEYVLLLPQTAAHLAEEMPPLPPNAQLLVHSLPTKACSSSWGAFGWYFSTYPSAAAQYSHYIFVTAAVNGPHMPTYAQGRLHWTQALTRKLSASVKLVGSTISCQQNTAQVDGQAWVRDVPWLDPAGAVATDVEGLALLLADPAIFQCYASLSDARYHTASGASMAVLAAGFGLDCLLVRYQGLDWKDSTHWGCNARLPPTGERMQNGHSLDPLEVLFTPLNTPKLQLRRSSARRAQSYTTWAREVPLGNVSVLLGNEHFAESPRLAGLRQLDARQRGPRCFDDRAYLEANADLYALPSTPDALWQHYLEHGMSQGRQPFWLCEADYSRGVVEPTLAVLRRLADALPDLPVCGGDAGAMFTLLGSTPSTCRRDTQQALAGDAARQVALP